MECPHCLNKVRTPTRYCGTCGYKLRRSRGRSALQSATVRSHLAINVFNRKRNRSRRMQHMDMLQKLSELSLQLAGNPDTFFADIVRFVASLFKAPVVCVAEIEEAHVRFKTVFKSGVVLTDLGWTSLATSPCAKVRTSRGVLSFENVSELFPDVSFLRENSAHAYLGIPIIDKLGSVSGVLCVIDDRPRKFDDANGYILQLISQRISFEMERQNAERLRSEAEEREREVDTRLRHILENVSEGFVVLDQRWCFTDVNPAAAKIIGLNRAALIGQPIPDEACEILRVLRDKINQADQPDFNELVVENYDQTQGRWYEARLCPIEVGFSIFINDVTQRKQIEQQMVNARDMAELALTELKRTTAEAKIFQQFCELAGQGIAIARLDGTFTYVNATFRRLLEIPPDLELTTLNCSALVSEHSRSFVRETVVPTVRRTGTWNGEFEVVTLTGKVIPFSHDIFLLTDDANQAIGYANIASDISERKAFEERLWESEQRFRQIAETIHEVFWVSSPDIAEILYISPGYERVWGRTCDSLYKDPRSFIEAIHPEDRSRVAATLDLQLRGKHFCIDYRIIRPDGSLRHIWDQCFPIYNDNGVLSHYIGVAQDVTERYEAENTLRKNEHLVKALIDSIPAYIAYFDLDERYQWVNQIYESWYNCTREQIIGKTLRDMLGEANYERVRDVVRLARNGQAGRHEHALVTADGRTRVLDLHYVPHKSDEGTALGFFILVFDITDERDAIESLVETEERYRKLFEASEDSIFLLDFSGRIQDANPAASRSLGYAHEELLAMNIRELDTATDANFASERLARIKAGEKLKFEVMHRRRDGSELAIEVSAVNILLNGQPFALAYNRDISERKRIEETIRNNSQVLLAMTEAVSFINDQGVIQFTNRALDSMYGYAPGELVGKSAQMLLDARDDQARSLIAEISKAIRQQGIWAGVTQNCKKDGTVFFAQSKVSQVNIDGKVKFITLQEDITQRKVAEEQVDTLRDQLAHASRLTTLGQMAAGLAHELNQPLAALRLYAMAAEESVRNLNTVELSECFKRIDEQSLRAAEIIRRMRSFANHSRSQRQSVDINRLILEVTAILDYDLRRTQIRFTHDLLPNAPHICVDVIQIQQVLVNLLRNSIDAMSQTDIDTRELNVTTQIENDFFNVSIADSGCGIEVTKIANLFDPFWTTKPSGMGLGLSICRTIIEAHSGTMGVKENSSNGATFFFSLPITSTVDLT